MARSTVRRLLPYGCLRLLLGAAVLSAVPVFAAAADADTEAIDKANRLAARGRYAEAEVVFAEHAADSPRAALRLAACRSAVGEDAQALKDLAAAIERFPEDARLAAAYADHFFQAGDYKSARKWVDNTLKLNETSPRARWLDAELHRVHGRIEAAEAGYLWLVQHYNRNEVTDPDDLFWIGQGAAQFARWRRNNDQYSLLVNELYPSILKLDPDYWPARLASARLFLEKYNQRQATADLNAALAINGNAAEAHAARAALAIQGFKLEPARASLDLALKINPRLLEAHQLKADILLAEWRFAEAIEVLEAARKLNPRSEETLGRLAAAYGAADGFAEDSERLTTLIAEVTKANEKCGRFFAVLGDSVDRMRKFPFAVPYYEEAIKRLPQLVGVRGSLGLVQMRLGAEEKAARLLQASFEVDPFNVRVKNMLEVLDVLQGYAVIETEHFVLRFDRGQDGLLARRAADYLEEEVFPELTAELGFVPPEKTLIEFFSRARNSSGHNWFSARMVGLPFIGTVGACAGKMVALASPTEMKKKYNWGRVLRHEFVHVINLQQTNFNIPHWFTEGLAVWHEGTERPPDWLLILQRNIAEQRLLNLDNINVGFIRPANQEQWTLAYCQAEFYVEYMVRKFGDDAPQRMLAAYADNLSTKAALKRCFNVETPEFEDGYRQYLKEQIADLVEAAKPQPDLRQLQRQAADQPDNADAQAALAVAYLKRKSNPAARKAALAARELEEGHDLAAYVLARLYLSIGDEQLALQTLEAAVDVAQPTHAEALNLLAVLKLNAKDYEQAERLYEACAKHFPHPDRWLKALTRVHLRAGKRDELIKSLESLCRLDQDNVAYRKKLAQLALAAENYQAAADWANQAILIDVMDAQLHALVGQAALQLERPQESVRAMEAALQIRPEENDWRLLLARGYVQAKDDKSARRTLKRLLELDAENEEAAKLLQELTQ